MGQEERRHAQAWRPDRPHHGAASADPGGAPSARAERGEAARMKQDLMADAKSEGNVTIRVWRGTKEGGRFEPYTVPADEGMVVLDVIHKIQALRAPDLAVRWNCKAGKCGSCS